MFPALTAQYPENGTNVDAKSKRNQSDAKSMITHLPNLPDLGIAKRSIVMPFSSWKPPLFGSISRIVFWSAQEKMMGIAAHFIVATMKHVLFWRYFSLRYNPRNTMSAVSSTPELSFPITSFEKGTGPRPTFRFLPNLNSGKESLLRRWLFGPTNFCSKQPDGFSVTWHKVNPNY